MKRSLVACLIVLVLGATAPGAAQVDLAFPKQPVLDFLARHGGGPGTR
jgi:hypothetical protein